MYIFSQRVPLFKVGYCLFTAEKKEGEGDGRKSFSNLKLTRDNHTLVSRLGKCQMKGENKQCHISTKKMIFFLCSGQCYKFPIVENEENIHSQNGRSIRSILQV